MKREADFDRTKIEAEVRNALGEMLGLKLTKRKVCLVGGVTYEFDAVDAIKGYAHVVVTFCDYRTYAFLLFIIRRKKVRRFFRILATSGVGSDLNPTNQKNPACLQSLPAKDIFSGKGCFHADEICPLQVRRVMSTK